MGFHYLHSIIRSNTVQIKVWLIVGLLVTLSWSCRNEKIEDQSSISGFPEIPLEEISTRVFPILPDTAPQVIADSLVHQLECIDSIVTEAKGRKRKVMEEKPMIVRVKEIIPGKDGLEEPAVYQLPKPESYDFYKYKKKERFTIQHGDTIFPPMKYIARHPIPVRVSSSRVDEDLIMDVQRLGGNLGLGIENAIVSQIVRDTKGNIWFNLQGNGFCKYDGSYLYHYSIDGYHSGKTWGPMTIDRDGNLWFPGWGIYKFDGTHFTHYFFSKINNAVTLLEDSEGNIWVGANAGLLKYNGNEWIYYGREQGYPLIRSRGLAEDDKGNIWIAGKIGFVEFDGKKFLRYRRRDQSKFLNTFNVIQKDNVGNLWFGGIKDLVKYDGDTFTRYDDWNHNFGPEILEILQDHSGSFWYGTRNCGLVRNDGHTFTFFENTGQIFRNTHSIIEIPLHTFLVGTGKGILKYRMNSFETINTGHFGEILTISEDEKGKLLIGNRENISSFDGNSFHLISSPTCHISGMIAGSKQGSGMFRIVTGTNIFLLDSDHFTQYFKLVSRRDYMGDKTFESAYTDREGRLWIALGGGGGIKVLERDTLKKIELDAGSDNLIEKETKRFYVKSFLQDSSGNMWLGTAGSSLLKYDGKRVIQYGTKGEIFAYGIRSLLQDRQGNLWIGSEHNGLVRFDGTKFTIFNEDHGLCNNYLTSLVEDREGNIWAGTKNGLALIIPRENGGFTVQNFYSVDGLKNLSFNENAVHLDSRNRLWWGTGYHLTMLDLNTFSLPEEIPELRLNNIYLDREFIDFSFLSSDTAENEILKDVSFTEVKAFENVPSGMKLSHRISSISFLFSAIYWSAPHTLEYQYYLSGLEDTWNEPTSEPRADYMNLGPGKYTFTVKAIGRSGIESEILEYPFYVRFPWWFRWWAILLYMAALAALVRYYIGFIISREKIKANLRIKQVEVEKMQEVDRMKSDFFSSISHEFRTPLTLITGPVEQMMKPGNQSKPADINTLKIIHRNARRLLQLINQLLDLSKLESGKIQTKVVRGDLSEFTRRVVQSFLSLAESRNVVYRYDIPNTPNEVFFDPDKLEKILTNLLSNAFKFTPEGGVVSLKLSYQMNKNKRPEHVKIVVKDTGRGIPDDKVDKIFDRFYQVSSADNSVNEGTGIGLSLVKELVDVYRGSIEVKSKPGKGCSFSVILPAGESKFEKEEISQENMIMPEPDPELNNERETEAVEFMSSSQDQQAEGGQGIILIVEDNKDLREYIRSSLSGPYDLIEAENGKAGLELAVENIPDLIITDLMMPEMDGGELCKRIRSDQLVNHIPLIMLTAKAGRESKLEGLEIGADDYLVKPFDVEELNIRVKNLIQQRNRLREKYQKEFIEKDPLTQKLEGLQDEFLDRVIKLVHDHISDSEFAVEQLAENIGISRSQLYRKLISLSGYTPTKFLRVLRLKQAVRLFKEGHANITEVLYSVGFTSPSYFAKSFNEIYGMNPSEYIKQKL